MSVKSPEFLRKAAEAALKEAVRKAIEDHAKTNDKVVIYQNGKVLEVSAKSLLKKKKSGNPPRK